MNEKNQPPRKLDWKPLLGPLLWLMIALGLGIGLLMWSQDYERAMQLRKNTRYSELNRIRRQHKEARSAHEIIDKYYTDFMLWKQRGFLGEGEEQRLNWMQHLTQLKEELKSPLFRYSISGQTLFEISDLKTSPGFDLYQSEMKLEASLLHEGDLFKLIDRLNSPLVAGLLNVEECILKREAPRATGGQVNVHASCRFVWYTADVNDK